MNMCFMKRSIALGGICCLIAAALALRPVFAGDKPANHKEGLKHYYNKEPDKAIKLFKEALAAALSQPVSGKPKEDEKTLLARLDDEKTAALANYQLGLIYEAQGKLDKAATMFNNALTIIAAKGARYVGVKTCKKCHFKQWRSWKKTKMAKAFEILKPGQRAEKKEKFNLDPKKDYSKDPKCLGCHTTGFGLPGGYIIPKKGNSKSAKRAKENAGTTCEACHGQGSKYITVHKDILKKKRQYTFDQLCQAGQIKPDFSVCTACHNRRNPTAAPDYHFDYDKLKAKGTHKEFPLKYRVKE